ncbi:helix-turn-helix transcriptional regulator [Tenacibaculum piscium]|uniref:helix-turn-helix transcriptional regulator n=1 Tax=Tenacibaculum piscium TaxID=1458515 RepID=UPI001EFB67A5|nr:helix-turn-helix transcriptional regulator [Tenacibaculum piscium]MCG8184074.1 helix-turn-helix transcriptional regulator [Tenacibaculum piscium]MCG8205467.1 helix-turn-helix transcriptional regulator [Tenacibaculum piscium]
MTDNTFHYRSVAHFLEILGYPSSDFSGFGYIDLKKLQVPDTVIDLKVTCEFYCIMYNKAPNNLGYGGLEYNLQKAGITFVAPNQVITGRENTNGGKGWILCFSPTFLKESGLLKYIQQYKLFNYQINEALNLNDTEITLIQHIVDKIKYEINYKDSLSGSIIVTQLELLLKYAVRITQKQRKIQKNEDFIISIENLLNEYFNQKKQLEQGLPKLEYLAEHLHISRKYLSTIFKKKTGIKPLDYIQNFAINKAKIQLLTTDKTIQEVAYFTGFSQAHYFIKIFKKYNDVTPKVYKEIHKTAKIT